ncbi:MAG: hypothetical protein ABSB29_02310 [Nitrososphaerales archaeon]|jgi:hypothetical protein
MASTIAQGAGEGDLRMLLVCQESCTLSVVALAPRNAGETIEKKGEDAGLRTKET